MRIYHSVHQNQPFDSGKHSKLLSNWIKFVLIAFSRLVLLNSSGVSQSLDFFFNIFLFHRMYHVFIVNYSLPKDNNSVLTKYSVILHVFLQNTFAQQTSGRLHCLSHTNSLSSEDNKYLIAKEEKKTIESYKTWFNSNDNNKMYEVHTMNTTINDKLHNNQKTRTHTQTICQQSNWYFIYKLAFVNKFDVIWFAIQNHQRTLWKFSLLFAVCFVRIFWWTAEFGFFSM